MLPGVNTIQQSISDLLIVVFVTESYARLPYTKRLCDIDGGF